MLWCYNIKIHKLIFSIANTYTFLFHQRQQKKQNDNITLLQSENCSGCAEEHYRVWSVNSRTWLSTSQNAPLHRKNLASPVSFTQKHQNVWLPVRHLWYNEVLSILVIWNTDIAFIILTRWHCAHTDKITMRTIKANTNWDFNEPSGTKDQHKGELI